MKEHINNGNVVNISGNNHEIGDISQSIQNDNETNKQASVPLSKVTLNRINDLIKNNFLEEAVKVIEENSKNKAVENMCLSLSRQLYTIKEELIKGVITPVDANQRKNMITDQILKLKDF